MEGRAKDVRYLFLRHAFPDPLEAVLDLGAVEQGVAQQDAGEVHLRDGVHAARELQELQLDHLALQVRHEPGRKELNNYENFNC